MRAGRLARGRHEQQDPDERDHADGRDGPERRAPAVLLAQERAERHAQDVGGREAREHHRDGPGPLGGRDHVGRDDRADAEERTVAQRREDASGEQQLVGGGEGRDQVPGDEQDHEAAEDRLAVEADHGGGEADRADGHRERVARDEVAGDGLGHAELGGDLRQETHDDELGEPDPEAPDGEGEKTQRHALLLVCVWHLAHQRVCNNRRVQ
ncbi:hypothetical protein D3C74_337060 [compost metagenome]